MEKKLGKELFKRTKIKNSPIVIVNDTEKKIFFGTMGEFKITPDYEKLEDAKKDAEQLTWNKITLLMHLIMESYKMTLKHIKEP